MSAESKPALEFGIGHVLFIDIVGYSKLLIDDQHESLEKLNQIVRNTSTFASANAAGKLSRLPTGDGMVLVFASTPAAPVQCALEISRALQSHLELHVRMGIHSGPVSAIRDLNDRANVAGGGINMAQRVMDCGDAGHILVSKRLAEDLEQYRQWQPHLHDLGEVEVKHGVRVAIVNLYTDELGNREVPAKFRTAAQQPAGREVVPAPRLQRKIGLVAGAVGLLAVLGISAWIFTHRIAPKSEKIPSESPSIPAKSIAVLPLENLSEEKENAFFADGIQDDVLTSLTKISDLKVISRTSVMQYRGRGASRNLREIAQALGVKNVLEGSVRRVGNRVLVNVQLIDARTDRHIWAERYDRTIADSIGLQGELATEIAKALKAKLAPEEKRTLETKPTSNPDAYVLYLRARELEENAETPEDLRTVNQLYAQAIALDPTFALAHAWASMSYSEQFFQTHDPTLKAKARAQAEEALRLSPSLGEAHLALGLYFDLTELNYSAALEQFTIALTALPNNVEALDHMARIYRRQGRWREAIAGFEQVRSLNPLAEPAELVRTYWMVRDWPAAAVAMKRNLARIPDNPLPRVGLAQIEVVANGNLAAAKAKLREIPAGVDPDGEVTLANWNLSMLERDFARAEKWLADFPPDEFPEAGPKSFYQAQTALAWGEVELARNLFEKVSPALEDNVRDHPDTANHHSALGILYAYMGRKEDAIREARRAVELTPEKTDALNGVQRACDLALVYALTGEADQAVTLIERLVRTPGATLRQQFYHGGITQAELGLRWQWDPLRSNPRFQKLLQGPEPKTNY
jgi:TolB-like protein/class 3 adenylate cyclase/Tfp pilus assembly protein PilF